MRPDGQSCFLAEIANNKVKPRAGEALSFAARSKFTNSGPGADPRTSIQAASAGLVGSGTVSRSFWVRPFPRISSVLSLRWTVFEI
jgi:hypothetical protein